MSKPKITIALSHYDRHVPFFDGTVKPEGIDLNVLIVGQSDKQRDGEDRHERMLQKAEFDVAELSLSSYLMAKTRGMPFTAIPVFPRRLFSHSQMWINISRHQRAERFDRQESRFTQLPKHVGNARQRRFAE
jgi:4,5-dihydroxyphthalate decarboxylase